MRITRTLGVTTVALLAVAMLAAAKRDDTSGLQGEAAPAFKLETLDGKAADLAAEKGNVVVLDFWATWCPPCRKSLPGLQAIHEDKELAAKGLRVFAVNLKEEKEKAKGYVEENKLTFAVPLDTTGDVAKEYKVQGIPTTVVIGRDGKIANVFVGFGEGSEQKLRDAITKALAAEKPAASVKAE